MFWYCFEELAHDYTNYPAMTNEITRKILSKGPPHPRSPIYDRYFVDIEGALDELKYLELFDNTELTRLGYACKGKLCDLELYRKKGVYERLWLWEQKGYPSVITLDLGNGWDCIVDLKDTERINDQCWFKKVGLENIIKNIP